MSSLWTPGGERPVGPGREAPPASPAPPPPAPEDGQSTSAGGPGADLARMLLESPAPDIVAQHVVGLIELAALHLTQPHPRLADARLAIDAAGALLDGVGDRLGEATAELRAGLIQLKQAYVQVAQASSAAPSPPEEEGR